MWDGSRHAGSGAAMDLTSRFLCQVTCNRVKVRTMPTSKRLKVLRDKVASHRNRLRQQGLRPIQIWVPDVRSPDFAREAHRQSQAVSKSRHAMKDQDFIDAISNSDKE